MRFIELESDRLCYGKFSEEDFPVVVDWLSHAENMKYRLGGPRNEAEVRTYLDEAIAHANADDCCHYEYAVRLKTDRSLIGAAVLLNLPDMPEIGWTIHRHYWRQGYGTEIGKTMLRLGFEKLGLRRIIAGCHAENHGSYKIMEHIGMRREAHFVKAQLSSGAPGHACEWCDRFQYALLQEEWEAMKQADMVKGRKI